MPALAAQRRDAPAARWRLGRDYQVIEGGADTSILFIAGNNRALRVSRDLGERLRAGLDFMSAEERAEWEALIEAGIVSEVNGPKAAASTFTDGSNLAINVNLTAFCNLGCTYCFAEGGDYGRITGKLEADVVEDIFAFIIEHVSASQMVRFEFFGGEPLLNFARIREIVERSEEVEAESGIRFIHRISTNLTVLPRGALELLARKSFIVSVSIDGDQKTHDRNRPTKKGEGSYATIMANCRRVREASDEVTLVARMTVLGGHPTLIENVRGLWRLDLFDYFQIYPGVVPPQLSGILQDEDAPSEGKAPRSMSLSFLKQLAEFVGEYPSLIGGGNRFKGVLEYERIADMVLSGKVALSYCSGGRNYFTFSPDKSIMPCHRLVGDLSMQVGTSQEGLSGKGLDVWRLPIDGHPVCSQCWIRYICSGGCKQENLQATGDLNTPSPEGCTYQIQMVENVLSMMAAEPPAYRRRDRVRLDDMFVSCGRPMVLNLRAENAAAPATLHHFELL